MKKFFLILFLVLGGSLQGISAADRSLASEVDGWKKAYERFDLDGFMAFYADDVVFQDPTARIAFTNKQQLRGAYTTIMQGRWGGNYRFDVQSVVQDGSTTVLEGMFSLTYNGEKAEIHFTTWLEFVDGRIKRQLDMFDYNELQRQLPGFGQSFPSEYTGPRE